MSGSNFTLTPNVSLYKPTFNSDVDAWGGHWNANADTLDSLLKSSGPGGTFLPLAGGTVTGPTVFNAPLSGSAFGMAIGQVPVFSNRGGRPSYELNGQWIINQAAPTGTQGADIFIRHDGSAVNTGTSANINGMMNMTMTVGANDATSNWGLVVHPSTNQTTGGQTVGAFIATDRLPGSNAHIWGALINVTCQTGLASSVVGQATLGQENDFASSLADDAVNPAKWGGVGNRHLVHYIVTRFAGATQNEVTTGLWFGTTNSYIDSVIGFDVGSGGGCCVRQVVDTRGAIPPTGVTDPVASVRMSAGQIIDFNGGPALNSAPGNYLQYTTTAPGGPPRLRYMVGTSEVMSVRDTGNIHANQIAITGDGLVPPVFIGEYTDGAVPIPSILINHDYNTTAGTVGNVASSVNVTSDVYGAPNYFVWSYNSQLNLRTTGVSGGQHLGFASTVNRFSGATPAWCYYGQHNDYTGLAPQSSSQQVAFELDIKGNGPEAGSGNSVYNPAVGSRAFFTLVNAAIQPAVWLANHAYTQGDVITASPSNGFTYIAQNTGTSGATQPTWPTSAGSVVNGGVTWAYGTTIATEISRAISIGTTGLGSSFGAAVFTPATYYDAILEFSYATLDTATNPNAAAIRLAPNMPIDFSGGKTLATQNLHTLYFDAASSKLFYAVGGVAKWSVDASGNMRCAGTVTGSVTP